MFKPKGRHVCQSQVEKFTRYSIRKVSFGAASVAVATGLFFLGGGSVQAAEQATNSETREVQNAQSVNDKSSESREVAGQASVTAKEPDGQQTSSAKESATNTQASPVETPNVVTEKVAINTASLEDLVAKVEGRLSQLTEGKKTKSVIDDAKNLVNKAKELLNDDTKTQAKVNALAKQLSSSLVILNSIKSETTEEKVNKNQDPRNGQAIPGIGESGFRDTGTVADGTENPVVVNTNDITQKASELEAEIAKVESLISAENAKGEGKTDKEFVGILTQVKESAQAVKNKGNNIPTTEKEKHALLQELKDKVDLLKLYQAKKLDWGAPANNHLANYGNNPSDAVISNLNDTFGTPDFSNATSHTKRAENQGTGIRNSINLGSATYHWKQKEITVDEAKAGALGGWKIVDKEGANTVNIVKPEAPTDIEYKEGQSATTYAPKPAKVYDNNGHVTATGGQGRANAGGGVLRYMISTDRLGNGSIGKVNKDYYVELKKQGTTIYKDFDVNPNSHLYANLVFSSAYGEMGLSSEGEKIKMRIVDAYTGQPLSELTRKDGKASDTEFIGKPGSDSDGFAALWRVVKVPEGTTKVRVFVEAGDQPTTSRYLNGHKVEDGYIVAGLGLTPGPALTLTTTVVSGKDKEAYGYTEDSIYKNAQKGTFNVTLSNHGGVGVVYQTQYEVTLKVPKGVKLGTLQGTDLNEVNGKNLFAPSYTYGFKYNKDTRELTFKIDLSKRNINPTSGSSNTVTIPFEVTPDFVGEATFEVVGKNGFGGKDKLGNMILPFGIAGADRYNIPVNVNANSLETSDNPDYKYNRSIYIDSMAGNSTITVPVGTTFEKAKEAATVSAEELLNSEAYRQKLATLKATAALNLSETSLIAMVQGYSTAAVKENSGTLKVPVIHTIGSKNFNNQIDINVNVVASTKQQKVVFEGDTIQNDDIKGKITPATIPGYTATTNNVQNMPTTTGKAGQIINVETTVSYTKGNVVLPETVTVPVLVLPKATGNVEVIKGATVDKVKEVAKAKATEVATSADFKAKLPEGSKDVVVGEITEEVLATMTAEKGTNKGIVKVPVTYSVDGTTYTKDAEITVNVLGSEPKTVYTVEGTKPDAEKVKNAVTPGTGGTVGTPTETDLPETTGKVGAKDVTATTTVTYPSGTETVNVPVEVLPKATPEKVITLKDTTSENLTTAVKEKAQAALGKLVLPSGVTAELVPNQNYTVPATTSNGDKDNVPVKVQYKDATGTVVAEDTISVPVTVVSSTPSKIVVFEGETPTAEQAKEAVTPGTDGTKGEPTTLPETAGKAGATDVKVDVPVTYDNGKLTETVSVPLTVLPKATGEADVPKGSTVDKVKEVAKAKASALVEAADFKGKLPTGATVTVGDITEAVAETLTNEKGTNKGVVNVPATYTVDGKTYNTTVPVTINVLGSEPKTVYTVEGTKPDAEKVKNAVTPGTGGTVNAPSEAGLPETTGKVGAKDVTVPTTVTYPTGDETVNVPVEVLPKATPEKVTTLKDTTSDNLTTTVKEKAQAALGKLTLPSGVTVELDPNQTYTVPATDSNGDKDNVPVKVQYKDNTGTVVAEDTINVPVTVVSSTPSKIVVFEGETPTAEQAKAAVTPGTDGTKGEPTTLPETAGKAGATDVKVDVPVTYDNGKLTETVSVPVTVLPKPEADEILVPKNGDKDKAKEKVLAQAEKAIADGTFTGKLPQGARVEIDKTAPVTVPDLTDDTEVDVTVKYTVDGQEKTTTVKVPVTVVEGVAQIVPVDENNKQPDPEKSIDKTDYPEGSTFRYKTPDGQTSPIYVTTTGDKNVVVEVLDPQGNTIVEVPATVRVVGSTPQFVVADPAKKQPEAKNSVTPGDYPEGTTFEYKTPVDTTTAGEKDVTVVAKLNGQPIAEVPAKVVVVDPKTQYVVADPSKPQPDASKSIDPEQYPDGTTFEYKTPVDTTTPGEKDVVVVAKDGEDKLVEVPTKVKVVQGNLQIVPVDEGKKQPSPEDSIDSNDYPEDATFEYKEEVDTSTPGDKKVTVVVKQGDKVLVEVPSTVRVVGSTPQFVVADPTKKQPEAKDSVIPGEYPDGTTFEYKTPVDTITAGEKDVTVVAKLNGQPIAEVPAKVVVVEPKTQYVVADPSKPQPDASKSIDPEQYPDGTTFEYKTPVDTTTPGEKDVVVVAKDGEDKLVEVPTKVKVVQGNLQIVPVDEGKKQPSPEDSIDSNDYPEDATFEYKEEVDTSTPGDKKVTVVVKQGDKVLVEVPSTVRVVESYPKYVPVDPTKKQPDPKENINPNDFPTGTTFEYKDNTPVDTTTPGEKDVTVVAKLNGLPITEIPAKIVVVESKTQYVPVNAESDKKPKPQGSITPDDYPEGTTFEYKTPEGQTTPYDGSTPGEKDVTVVVKDSDGDTIVEVPAKIKVVQGKEQLTPVNAEDKDKPKAEDSITPSDYPEGSTFEYKVPEGQTTPYDGTTPGDKPVTVVVKDKDGKVLVEVPATIKVVETKPTPIETPVTTTPLTPEDYTKGIKIPEGGKVTNVANIPDLTTPGKKDPVKVTIELPNGKVITVDVPVTVTPVKEIETPVTTTPLTPEDYTKGIKIPEGGKVTNVANIPDLTTPGKKDPVKVTVELPNGKAITVEVPVTVTPKSQNGGGVISQNGDSTVQIVTEYLDENGNRITSDKEGKHNPIELEGYEYSHSTTDFKGNTLHHYKKVTNSINQEQPSAPETPTSPEKPVATPVQTSSTDSKQVAETTVSNDKKELPNTGTEDKAGLASLGLLGMLGAFGLVARKKKED
ncbi:Rib/alpha-like domain-containing protein [uncultured Streptococcus sp.]|uniref:Rib/alpha-like domain-containing protein n=1 Tax=uncultured Streptococcus sp. TaxID=83427 RepID=UPI0028EAF2D1|nr:Rib/alpha-like domain-containing protein [uncultured Streptococcus sp.]